MRHPIRLLFLALVLTALGQAIWQHDHLPDRVAAHFNGAAIADMWLTRGQQTAWHLVTILFLAALFLGLTAFQHRLPKESINLPHRDYWLAPERAAATHRFVATITLSMGCVVMLFFIAVFHLIYRANLSHPPRLGSSIWWLTGGLLFCVAAALLILARRFRRPAPPRPA